MQWNSFLQRGTSLFLSSRFIKWKRCPYTSISGVRKNEVSEEVLERSRQYLSNIPSDYEKLLQVLYSINTVHPVSYSLANSEQLYELCQRPMDNIPTIHITGTNGKGSIGIKLSKFFETEVSAVQKTGLFVSPHISCFRERIQINSHLVTQKEVELLLPELLLLCREHGIPATFFELTTMLSFLCFQKRNCEVVVLEVGMGGRLDATNVIPSPCIAIVSSIQLDHTHVLGTTREQIAREKSGIVKQFCPVLLGPDCELEIFRAAANSAQAGEVHTVNEILHHSMDFRHQYSDTDKLNADIARAAIQILATPPVQRMEMRIPHGLATIDKNELLFRQKSSFLQQALDGVSNERRHESTAFLCRPPCRMEEFFVYSDGAEFQNGLDHSAANVMYKGNKKKIRVVLDVAHNKMAMQALQNRVESMYARRPVRIIVGMSGDKDAEQCSKILLQMVGHDRTRIYCTQADHPRAMPLQKLRGLFQHGRIVSDKGDCGVKAGTELTTEEAEEVLIVCGTMFMMPEARVALGVHEPKDNAKFFANYSFQSNEFRKK